MKIFIKTIYSLSMVFWIGSVFFFSFIAAPSIFKVLPRELAGDVVADIFNKYYYISYICGAIALFTLSFALYKGYLLKSGMNLLAVVLIILMLGISVISGTYLRDRVAEVKHEIRETGEVSDKTANLNKKFRTLHGISAGLNLLIFVFGIAVVVINTYNIRGN